MSDALLPEREAFTLGRDEWVRRWMSERSAASHAGFFVPQLRPGMRVLDCGCGPGSISLDLAQLVRPGGEVVGIDLDPRQVAAARAQMSARGSDNVRFDVADAYALPFAAGTFEAVFAQSLLMHVRDPLAVMREVFRVLKPGGVFGVRDPDYGAWLWAPETPEVTEFARIFCDVVAHHGSPFYARHQRRLLREAGFARTSTQAQTLAYGEVDGTRATAQIMARVARSAEFQATAVAHALATPARLDELCVGLTRWGEAEDAVYVMVFVETLAWRGGD